MPSQDVSQSAPLVKQVLASVQTNNLLRLHNLLLRHPDLVNADLGNDQVTAANMAVEMGNEAMVVLLIAQCVLFPVSRGPETPPLPRAAHTPVPPRVACAHPTSKADLFKPNKAGQNAVQLATEGNVTGVLHLLSDPKHSAARFDALKVALRRQQEERWAAERHISWPYLVFIIATLLVWALFVFAYYATHWPHHARALVGERLWQLALDGVDFMERMMKIDPKVLDAWASGYRGEASLEGVPEEMKNVARQTHAQRVQRAKQFGVEL